MMLLVTGTRYADVSHGWFVYKTIAALIAEDDPGPHELYVGDAKGVDDLAARAFRNRAGWTVTVFEARWEECAANCPPGTDDNPHRQRHRGDRDEYCPLAGTRRNRAMVEAYRAAGGVLVLPFPAANLPSRGTRGCVGDARRAGLTVLDEIPLEVSRRGGK